MVACTRYYPLLVLPLLALSGWTARGLAEQQTHGQGSAPKGFQIERIEQKRTEAISWIRVQVVADTSLIDTWSVLQDVEAWDQFVRLFPRVTTLRRAGTMTQYRLTVSPPWPVRDFESVIWMAKLPEERLMLWRSDKDNLGGSHGRLELEEIPGGTRVSYEMHSPLKGAFPKWVVRIGLYIVLPGMAQDFYDRINPPEG